MISPALASELSEHSRRAPLTSAQARVMDPSTSPDLLDPDSAQALAVLTGDLHSHQASPAACSILLTTLPRMLTANSHLSKQAREHLASILNGLIG